MNLKRPVVAIVLSGILTAPFVTALAKVQTPKTEPANQPMVTVSETEFDFGRVVQDASVSHGYWIKNTGGDTLRIADVKPGCGCTKAPIEKRQLAVGDSTRVELIFSTGKMNSKVRKSATIMSNAAGIVPKLAFSADVRTSPDSLELYTVVPARVDLDKSKPGEQKTPWEYELTLKNTTDIGLTFSLVSQPDKFITVDLPANTTVDAGQDKSFTVRIDPSAEGHVITKSFTIEASDDARTRMTIPVVKLTLPGGTETSQR
ncbi:MAG: DUF1573 domain-containing protein [Candidatus Zixiibacteriota bacterium]